MNLKTHPILPAPSMQEILAESSLRECTQEQAFMRLLKLRQNVIEAETADPLRCGWEPPIWIVCDCLIDWEWVNPATERMIQRRFGLSWQQFKQAMRKKLGFSHPARMLLILGGNRSGKSEYAAKRCMEMLCRKEDANVYPMHMSNPRSVRDQQPLFWKYMPPEWKVQKATETTYIKFKQKTGFSEGSFITPIGSECAFLNYMQDRDTALEGLEADLTAPDELIPPDWIETLSFRLATRAGVAIITFTPVNGYTPSVKIFCDGAKVAMESIGYLLPTDGGDRAEAAALGLSAREYQDLLIAAEQKTAARVPASRPEDCFAWIDEDGKSGAPPDADLAQRTFEKVPRVLKCVDGNKAVVCFHSSDNPYGNPKEVVSQLRSKGTVWIRERFYGRTDKTISGMFPKFTRKVHVIRAQDIPPARECQNYMICDPASNRNFFMGWLRLSKVGKVYLYREWPGRYHLPGIGVPGPWTIPSGKKEGLNDGARGEAQGPFGFGLLRYKFEIARLEGWSDWKTWKQSAGSREDGLPDDEDLADWEESRDDDEIMEERLIDSRAASAPRVENDRPVTLQTDFDDIGLHFGLTPGSDINEGVSRINSALDYDGDGNMTFFNSPDLYISEECENIIYSMENWLNVDGDKGACKDPVDILRYFFTAGFEYDEQELRPLRSGTSYGARRHRCRTDGNMVAIKGRRLPPAVRER
jgi:hypothetical protein